MSRHLVANDPYDEILNDIKEHMTCAKDTIEFALCALKVGS